MTRVLGGAETNSTTFGPFSVSPRQIVALGPERFTLFINELLAVETASAGMLGSVLTTTYRNNVADGGVDAGLTSAAVTRWIPAGDSAWQFKSGDLSPQQCKQELESAVSALQVLKSGGSYRLAIGVSLTHPTLKSRRDALIEKAQELGISLRADSIEVYSADALARWAEEHPSLAVSPLLGGIDHVALSFTRWADSNRQASIWVDAESRRSVIDQIHNSIKSGEDLDLRIQGASGLGKSRTVLEALRGEPYEALVLYVNAFGALAPNMINQLLAQDRVAIVVVDQCGGKQHESLAELIPRASRLRLITLGEDDHQTCSPVLSVPPLESAAMDELLKINQPNLWTEARRVVTEMAGGNIGYALALARIVVNHPDTSTTELINAKTIRTYVTQSLPGGTVALACHVLALFTRVGYERELATELAVISDALALPLAELKSAALALRSLGFLSAQGRYRSVVPHPLAVFLAAGAWEELGDEILRDMLPRLPLEMAERLFRRAADIGNFGPTRVAVARILSADGPFAKLGSLAEAKNSRLLTQFAIVAPTETCEYLTSLISTASDTELTRHNSIRRDLVWTLEKLVWHRETFEAAADCLLKLAVNETEDCSNNASGTWIDLFGVMLPGTAARSAMRATYLTRISRSLDPRARRLAVAAAAKALTGYESIMVSGELQGGVLVEARGAPDTYGEVWEYQKSAIDVLGELSSDPDGSVSASAVDALVAAIHPLLEIEPLRANLASVLGSLPRDGLREVRTQMDHLAALFKRVESSAGRAEGVEALNALLPTPSVSDALEALVHSQRYDFEDGELLSLITGAATELPEAAGVQFLFDVLNTPVPAAYEVGRALAVIRGRDDTVVATLIGQCQGENLPALVGYLWGLVELSGIDAFDEFLDGPDGVDLGALVRLQITVRGTHSNVGWQRIVLLLDQVSVAEASRSLFGWHADLTVDRILPLLQSWLPRISSQPDFNATVDFINMALRRESQWLQTVDPLVSQLVEMRTQFPALGQQSRDWVRLAKRRLDAHPTQLLGVLLEMINGDTLQAFDGTEESRLLKAAIQASGAEGWRQVATQISSGAWRLQMDVQGWFTGLVPIGTVSDWICGDVDRARSIASVTPIEDAALNPVARLLLTEFETDIRIASALHGAYVSDAWSGKGSDRLSGKIAQLERWQADPGEPDGVRNWARSVAATLRLQRTEALNRESEGDY